MAGNLKQRLIKAGRDFNFAEGVKVLNSTTSVITKDTIVRVVGYEGPFLKVDKIFTTAVGTAKEAQGRLMIMKHDLPASGYGVALPWKLVVTALNFSSKAVGDVVYGAANGGVALTDGGGAKDRIVGHVIDNSATAGAYLFSGEIDKQELP